MVSYIACCVLLNIVLSVLACIPWAKDQLFRFLDWFGYGIMDVSVNSRLSQKNIGRFKPSRRISRLICILSWICIRDSGSFFSIFINCEIGHFFYIFQLIWILYPDHGFWFIFIAHQHTGADVRYWCSNSVCPSVCLSVTCWYCMKTV